MQIGDIVVSKYTGSEFKVIGPKENCDGYWAVPIDQEKFLLYDHDVDIISNVANDQLKKFDDALQTIKAANTLEKVKELVRKREIAFDGQEFGATFGDLEGLFSDLKEMLEEKVNANLLDDWEVIK